jgi:homoaconitase/3-isopropylmalate dehydratase large subunit
MVAAPHSPDNVKTVRELAGMEVDQVLSAAAPTFLPDLTIVAGMSGDGRFLPG